MAKRRRKRMVSVEDFQELVARAINELPCGLPDSIGLAFDERDASKAIIRIAAEPYMSDSRETDVQHLKLRYYERLRDRGWDQKHTYYGEEGIRDYWLDEPAVEADGMRVPEGDNILRFNDGVKEFVKQLKILLLEELELGEIVNKRITYFMPGSDTEVFSYVHNEPDLQ